MKRIEYLIKNNSFVQKTYVFCFSLFYRFIALFVRIDKKLILFNSFGGKCFNDSPRVLFERIINDEKYKDYKCVWSFTNPKAFKGKVPCKIVKQDSFRYFATALKAGYWITNVNIERGLKIKRKRNICLNTWHGTGPKTIGNAVRNRKDYNFTNIDYILADGEFLKQSFINNFNARPENVYTIGRPREDILFSNKDNKDIKDELLLKYGFPKNKKYILFAPTWRESSNKGKTYDIGFSFNLKKWVETLGDDYIVLFRAHSITNDYNIGSIKNVIDVTSIDDIASLYLIADILVSDYSSCFTDFSILGKPMFCFAPDYDDYSKERGLVYDLNPFFTSGVIKDEDNLLELIKNMDIQKEILNTKKYFDSFVSCTGNSIEKSLELLFSRNK